MYHIVYSTSNAYAPYCLTSICSLLEHNRKLKELHFHILSNNIDDDMRNKFSNICETFGAKIEFYDIEKYIKQLTNNEQKLKFNPSSFVRVFLPEILPLSIEKALYLDSDTYINSSIDDLYNININNYPCAMCFDQPIYESLLQDALLKRNSPYFNAGVILMNLRYWRNNHVVSKIVDFYYVNNCNFALDDQSVINGVLSSDILPLDYKYNAMCWIFFWSYKKFCSRTSTIGKMTKKIYLKAKKHPVIVHFNGPNIPRPWEKWCCHPYKNVYRKTLKKYHENLTIKKSSKKTNILIFQYLKHKSIDKIEQIINH